MKNKRTRGILSLILFLLGLFFIINPKGNITGAVIGSSLASGLSSSIGLLLMIIAGILFMYKRESLEERILEEKIIDAEEFGERFRDAEPDDKKRVLILDTSAILPYSPNNMEDMLKGYDKVLVPKSVLDEIRDPHLKRVIKNHSQSIEGYEKYREIAKNYLEKTEKPQMYKTLMPYLDKILSRRLKAGDITPKELELINEKTKQLQKLAKKDKFDVSGDFMGILRKIKDYLETHCKISQADIDVLAMALYAAMHHKHALIGEKDIDLRQAIDEVKEKQPDIAGNIDYVEPYAT